MKTTAIDVSLTLRYSDARALYTLAKQRLANLNRIPDDAPNIDAIREQRIEIGALCERYARALPSQAQMLQELSK